MKTFIFSIMFAMVFGTVLTSCGNTANGGAADSTAVADTDSVAVDSIDTLVIDSVK